MALSVFDSPLVYLLFRLHFSQLYFSNILSFKFVCFFDFCCRSRPLSHLSLCSLDLLGLLDRRLAVSILIRDQMYYLL